VQKGHEGMRVASDMASACPSWVNLVIKLGLKLVISHSRRGAACGVASRDVV